MYNSSTPLIEEGKVYPFYGTGTPSYEPNSPVVKPSSVMGAIARRLGEYATTHPFGSSGYSAIGSSTGTGTGKHSAAATAEDRSATGVGSKLPASAAKGNGGMFGRFFG